MQRFLAGVGVKSAKNVRKLSFFASPLEILKFFTNFVPTFLSRFSPGEIRCLNINLAKSVCVRPKRPMP